MILKHNVSFVGGVVVQAGTKLSKAQIEAVKKSGTKVHEQEKPVVKEKKTAE